MGAWGTYPFENDEALDYADSITSQDDPSQLGLVFDRTLASETSYLEAPDAEQALAAAEIVACFLGRWGKTDSYSASLDQWVRTTSFVPSLHLIQKARDSVKRVLTEPSELLELWAESDELEAWKDSVNRLGERLR